MLVNCQKLKKEYEALGAQVANFKIEFEKVRETGNLNQLKESKTKIEKAHEDLFEKIDPDQVALRRRLAREHGFREVGKFPRVGLAKAILNNDDFSCVYIDEQGNEKSSHFHITSDDFSEGRARVCVKLSESEYREYHIDETGKFLSNNHYINAYNFSCGLALVQTDREHYFFINQAGDKVFQEKFPAFKSASSFNDNCALVKIGYYEFFISTEGNELFDCHGYSVIYGFSDGLAHVKVKLSDKIAYIDQTGEIKILCPDKVNMAFDFHDGMARITTNEGTCFIDKNGKLIPGNDVFYQGANDFSCGRGLVHTDGRFFYLDQEGKRNPNEDFDYATDFSENKAIVKQRNEWFVLDLNGRKTKIKIPNLSDKDGVNAVAFKDGLAVFSWTIMASSKHEELFHAAIDKRGNYIPEFSIREIIPIDDYY